MKQALRWLAGMGIALVLVAAASAKSPGTPRESKPARHSASTVTPFDAISFAHPELNDRPWVRLNMPPNADPEELKAEVRDLHRSGIAGIEVGQGAFPNNEQLIAILKEATRFGLKVSLSHGPTQYPSGYSLDDDNARKTLAFGSITVATGNRFDGPLPPPRPPVKLQFRVPSRIGASAALPSAPAAAPVPQPEPPARSTLVAVLAYRCVTVHCSAGAPAILDASSAMDLTPVVTGGNTEGIQGGTTLGTLHWSPPATPAGSQWQVIAFWARGVFAQPDTFSKEGFLQLVHSLDTALSPEVKALMRANRGDIFYDSHTVDRGSPDELWTNKMPEEFQKRSGYSLLPKLAALFPDAFSFSDGSAARVRNDLYRVRGDLWITTQLIPLSRWVHTLNYSLRVQPEGEMSTTTPISDQVQVASILERPEHESLFANDEVDNYLPIASANHMTGNTWYSTECCAALNMNYAQTFQDMTIRMHRSYAGGMTKLIYHVFPYRDSATSMWPGYHNFGQAGFSNAWGPRDPNWIDAKVFNDYFARMGLVLTQGTAKTDVAIYMQNYLYPQPQMMADGKGFRIWRDTKLQEAGYTRDYLDPAMLGMAKSTVAGKRLASTGPAYKALVIDGELQPASDPDKRSMPVEVAKRILGFARQGLPVIVVASAPDHVPGNEPAEDATLQQVVARLLSEPTVYRVAHESDVPAKLRSLGIEPSAQTALPGPLLSVHRYDDARKTDYYFFYNQGSVSPEGEPANLFKPAMGEHFDTVITLEGRGRPYLVDAWAGRITPLPYYQIHGRRIALKLNLVRDDATVIAVSEGKEFLGTSLPEVHVVKTTADAATARGGSIFVRASTTGAYITTLSNGQTVATTIEVASAAMDLTGREWNLSVEDWMPAHPYVTTFGLSATETLKPTLKVPLHGLRSWPEIGPLQKSSGVGTYSITFDLPARWTTLDGAMLSLGQVFDSFELLVNGKRVPINQLSAVTDVGPYLRVGHNGLVIRVATTLNNRLAAVDEDVRARGLVQPYGLVGPVVLTPYREVKVFSGPSPLSGKRHPVPLIGTSLSK